MIRLIFIIELIFFCFIGNSQAQKIDRDVLIDSIKGSTTQFFVKEGLLDKQKVGDSRDYIFATEIRQKRPIGYDSNGIYRIGVYQSHSPEHILIKYKQEFKILSLEHLSVALKELITFSEKNNINDEIMLIYLKEVINLYELNYADSSKARKLK